MYQFAIRKNNNLKKEPSTSFLIVTYLGQSMMEKEEIVDQT